MLQFLGDSKSRRASKSHYWFKSYGNFAEWVNFAYWWRCIGKGLRLQPAQQACFTPEPCLEGNTQTLMSSDVIFYVTPGIQAQPWPPIEWLPSDLAKQQQHQPQHILSQSTERLHPVWW